MKEDIDEYMKELFCDKCKKRELEEKVPQFVAELLDVETKQLIGRYSFMRDNFDCDNSKSIDPIKCTPPSFKADFSDKKTIGLDLPTWFNVKNAEDRIIMLIAQSPLRDNDLLYDKHREVTVSSPFGLHDAQYRPNGNGGEMMYALVQRLVASGYGIYLTDAYKFFVDSHKFTLSYSGKKVKSCVYAEILQKEIDAVNPSLCVFLGKESQKTLPYINPNKARVLKLPLLTGMNRRAIVKEFSKLKSIGATNKNIAKQYAKAITKAIAK